MTVKKPLYISPILLILAVCLPGLSSAIVTVPSWEGEPNSTFASYTFTTGDRTAPPEASTNPYGAPSLLVEDEQIFGTGWQDPDEPFKLTRVAGEGAWDLGQEGRLSITIPIASAGDTSTKPLEFFVNVVWYLGPVNTPIFTVDGHAPTTSAFESELVELDGAGSWRRTVWQASFDDYEADTATLVLQAPSNGSVIDSVTIYSLIPEPGPVILVVLGAVGLALRRQRIT